jgi:uncharacterized protein YvpB
MYETLIGIFVFAASFLTTNVFSPQQPVPQPKPVVIIPSLPIKYVALKVPLHHQIYNLSCEAASLEMALGEKGVTQTQDQLLTLFGVSDPKQSYLQNGTMIWGDPNLGFVGNVQGYFSTKSEGMRGATGWGVNNGPVLKAAQSFRPDSAEYSNFTSAQVMKELDNGNPVIFWHVPDSYAAGTITYQTPEGKTINFFRNHVAVISGYKIQDGITTFMISDPLYGEYTLQKRTLERRMAKYNGDVVVVR